MPRKLLAVRIAEEPMGRLEALRDEYGITLTQVVRALFAIALRHPEEVKRVLATMRETR